METLDRAATAVTGAASRRRPLFGGLRRWWIRQSLPAADSDLTPEEWTALQERYVAAGGSAEEFDRLIERDVADF